MQHGSFYKNKEELKSKLSASAFRCGTSAFRLGLIPMGISDHLPIQAEVKFSKMQISLVSWNLLSDTHLFNNFMNITGTQQLREAILVRAGDQESVYCTEKANKLYYLFSELAQYLLAKNVGGTIEVNNALLQGFVSNASHPSRLSLSRDPIEAKKKVERVEASRREIIEILCDQMHPHAYEFRLAIKHSLELIYHIQSEAGALRWENRFVLLRENKPLLKNLIAQDILCLQECTNPEDILGLYHKAGKQMTALVHKIDSRTRDHCVILFDKARFTLAGEPIMTAFEGQKPCIYVRLRENLSGEVFVVASIHHPGGNKNLYSEMMKQVNALRVGPYETAPFLVAGDFNHTQPFFEAEQKSTKGVVEVYPTDPTMAGSDYGHVNKAIDAVVTNLEVAHIAVSRVKEVQPSRRAETAVVVTFEASARSEPGVLPATSHAPALPALRR